MYKVHVFSVAFRKSFYSLPVICYFLVLQENKLDQLKEREDEKLATHDQNYHAQVKEYNSRLTGRKKVCAVYLALLGTAFPCDTTAKGMRIKSPDNRDVACVGACFLMCL